MGISQHNHQVFGEFTDIEDGGVSVLSLVRFLVDFVSVLAVKYQFATDRFHQLVMNRIYQQYPLARVLRLKLFHGQYFLHKLPSPEFLPVKIFVMSFLIYFIIRTDL